MQINKLFYFLIEPSFLRISFLVIVILLGLLLVMVLFAYIKDRKLAGIEEKIFQQGMLCRLLKYKIIVLIILVSLLGLAAVGYLFPQSKVINLDGPSFDSFSFAPEKPLELIFNRPIDASKIHFEISPSLAVKAEYNTGLFKQQQKILFYPLENPDFDTRYTVSVGGLSNIFSLKETNFLFSFLSAKPPTVEQISPSDGDIGVLPNQAITININGFSPKTTKFDFVLTPETEFSIEENADGFTLRPTKGLVKGTHYTIEIFQTSLKYDYVINSIKEEFEKQKVAQSSFTVIDSPKIKSYSPQGSGVLVDSEIVVTFMQDMDRQSVESNFSIEPKQSGIFRWANDREFKFSPGKEMSKNTKYLVKLSASSKTKDSRRLDEEFSYSFTTIGHVAISKTTPSNNSVGVEINSPVSIYFNQAVDHTSAEDSFAVGPKIAGTFSWNGNTMIFNHSNFDYGQKYSVTINSGIKSIHGLDSTLPHSFAYTTKTQSIDLNVTAYKQQHMYSCMIAAARSALSYKGVNVSEADIINRTGYDNTAWSGTWNEPGSVWGDPNEGIVGDLDGKADNIGWGYGSHWNPIAKAIRSYGKTAEVKTSWNVNDLAREIAAGNPVIIWWVNGVWPAHEVYWNKNGQSIRGVNSMHVQVVKGFTGTVDNPLSFKVTDSGYGYPGKSFDIATFKAKWNWFSNTAIILR